MSQTLPLANGAARSPGKLSPTGMISTGMSMGAGRTMKEYEDQLGALKKENFNLKLRIYFLEERIGITAADEDAVRKNIELKVEIESLRKELSEKQELLAQAAKAFELMEEQKETSSRNEAEYLELLESKKEEITKLEKELEEYRQKTADASFYKQICGVTPEEALENEEKLRQMEELVSSLESEVKRLSQSLQEERSWAQELESERDRLKDLLETESNLRNNLTSEKLLELEELRVKLQETEELVLQKEGCIQRCKNEIEEKDRLIREKTAFLEEKTKAYDEASSTAERRKVQIDRLRASVKSRDEALAELNDKHRALLIQFENSGRRRNRSDSEGSDESKEVKELIKELEEKDSELKRQEEIRKQLILKSCNLQKQVESSEQKLKKLEVEHQKAIKTIQGFLERQQQMESSNLRKERKIQNLEKELKSLQNSHCTNKSENEKSDRDQDLERNSLEGKQEEEKGVQVELQDQLQEKDEKILNLEEKISRLEDLYMKNGKEIKEKTEQIENLQVDIQNRLHDKEEEIKILEEKISKLEDLNSKSKSEITEKNEKIENLTQNLQTLVNTELWSKNKEIARLQNDITCKKMKSHQETKCESNQEQLIVLKKELEILGIKVSFTNNELQLNYTQQNEAVNLQNLAHQIQTLAAQKSELEKEVDYLKWLKIVARPDITSEIEGVGTESERMKKYCELLRTNLKDLIRFMTASLRNEKTCRGEQKKIILEFLASSKILSDDFLQALDALSTEKKSKTENGSEESVRRTRSDDILDLRRNSLTQSDSETFSEPDRKVSMARIGLKETGKRIGRCRFAKYRKSSDSDDSLDYVPCHETHSNDFESKNQRNIKETNGIVCSELSLFRNEMPTKFDTLREKIKSLEREKENLTKELDRLTLSHSQVLVENTKLTNEKLRLEQEIRRIENGYHFAIADLNRINDSQKNRMRELEYSNEELRRNFGTCDSSDSAPSSSGISSLPANDTFKRSCENIFQDFRCYVTGSQSNTERSSEVPRESRCLQKTRITARCKASCSPDLGIESDVTSIRPLKDTLKITESMNNLLSDEENGNMALKEGELENLRRDIASESSSATEGLDEMEGLKRENECLKKKLMKTRRALEDTFRHLSTSNKNKKNVEKAITRQLMITKNVLKKTRAYEEPTDD